MNRVYKTKWSAAHQQYVVTDEHHATKGKASKSAIAIAVAALMMAAGAQAAYYEGDTSFVAKNNTQLDAARQSFETAEYNANWGLKAMKASTAYALGFHGQGVKVGMMDSGILRDTANSPTRIVGTVLKQQAHIPMMGAVIPSMPIRVRMKTAKTDLARTLMNLRRMVSLPSMAGTTKRKMTIMVLVAPAFMPVTVTAPKCTV